VTAPSNEKNLLVKESSDVYDAGSIDTVARTKSELCWCEDFKFALNFIYANRATVYGSRHVLDAIFPVVPSQMLDERARAED
jgi:hypothetical protein